MAKVSVSEAVRHLSSTTVAWVSVGASVFIFLAAGSHLLGANTYSSLAVAWTMVTIFGMGVAFPGEQTVTRSVSSGHTSGAATAVKFRLVVLAMLALPLLAFFVWGSRTFLAGSTVWATSAAVGIFGWAFVAVIRGRLVGAQKFHAYAAVLGVEAGTRIVLCALAWLFSGQAAWLLAAAVGVPLLASATLGWWLLRSEPHLPTSARYARLAEQSAMTMVALSIQAVLSTAPLWLAFKDVVPVAAVGAFVSATSYMRIPIVFSSGGQAMMLSHSSSAAAGIKGVSVLVRKTLGLAAGVCTVSVLVLLALSGPILFVLYGPHIDISWTVLILLGVTTVVFVVSNMVTQIFFGCQRSPSAAAIWLTAAVVTTVGLAIFATSLLWATCIVLLGVLLAAAVLFVALPRAVHSAPQLSTVRVDL